MAYRTVYFAVLVLIFSSAFVALIIYVESMQAELVETATLDSAKLTSQAISEFRSLYSIEVVEKAKAAGFEITQDYHGKPRAIPLPVTLGMELGKRIGLKVDGAETRLYSKYPFPGRMAQGGLRDGFQKRAWQALTKNPEQPFFEFTSFKGRSVLRYAVADRMRESCINCHNTHPDTPKNDWKVNDLRGVLEVVQPMEHVLALKHKDSIRILYASLVVLLLGAGTIYILYVRHNVEMGTIESKLVESSKMASLGNMAAGIAHEINQPLGAVLINSETALKLMQKEKYDQVIELCEKNAKQIKRATKIINSLRLFSREVTMDDRNECEVKTIVENVMDLIGHQFKQNKIDLHVDLEQNLKNIHVSLIPVEQVLTNLLLNALDALKDIDNEKKIVIRGYESPGGVAIDVTDNGKGIPGDQIMRIFEPFYTTKAVGAGTGLGLSISYGIMKDNGGELLVESEAGRGTTFTMIFYFKQGGPNE